MKYYIFFTLILFSLCFSLSSEEDKEEKKWNTTFGQCIGQSYLTKAYNCQGDPEKYETNYVLLKNTNSKIASGQKWQCVEYARRWLIDNKNLTFADVKYAYQIWNLKFATQVDNHHQVPLTQFKNKSATTPPQIGDLLIYSTDFAITGHVAVVVEVKNNSVKIAEQNYFNDLWDGADYSRRLLLQQDKEGRYRIFDDALIGWVRFG